MLDRNSYALGALSKLLNAVFVTLAWSAKLILNIGAEFIGYVLLMLLLLLGINSFPVSAVTASAVAGLFLLRLPGGRLWMVVKEVARAPLITLIVATTPQLLFFAIHPYYSEAEANSSVARLIIWYEDFILALNVKTEPIRSVGLPWWILFGVGLAWVAVKFHRLELLERSVNVREIVSTLLFFIAVSMSFSLTTATPTQIWEPDVRKRLVAVMKHISEKQTELLLAESIKSRIDSDPSFVRQNFPAPAALLHAKNVTDVKPDAVDRFVLELPPETKKLMKRYSAAAEAEAEAAEHEAILSAAREVGRERVLGIEVAPLAADDTIPGVTEAVTMYRSLTMQSKDVGERAAAARGAVAFSMISALDAVQIGSVPVLHKFLSEVISGAAGEVSGKLMEKLPLERALVIGTQFTDRVSDSIRSKIDLLVRAVVNCNGPNKSPLASMKAPALNDWIDREKAKIKVRIIDGKLIKDGIKKARP